MHEDKVFMLDIFVFGSAFCTAVSAVGWGGRVSLINEYMTRGESG
jgi:hypothetical protein